MTCLPNQYRLVIMSDESLKIGTYDSYSASNKFSSELFLSESASPHLGSPLARMKDSRPVDRNSISIRYVNNPRA